MIKRNNKENLVRQKFAPFKPTYTCTYYKQNTLLIQWLVMVCQTLATLFSIELYVWLSL